MQLRSCKSCMCCSQRLKSHVSRDSSLLYCCCKLLLFLLRLWAGELCLGIMLELELIW